MHEHDEERDRLLDSWDAAAPGWGRQADRVREEAMPISAWMVAAAKLQPGLGVVELAAGPGDTGFLAAAEVLPGGTLICSDASQAMLDIAEDRAQEQGITNVEFKQLQLEWIDLPTASADVILIKWALMLLLDPLAAAKECRRVLKPGGRLVAAVWDMPELNPWVLLPQQALRELGHLPPLPAPTAGAGMFALAGPGQLESVLQDAGFFEVGVEPISAPRTYGSLSAWLGETRDLSTAFRQAWDPLDDKERGQVRERLTELSRGLIDSTGVVTAAGGCLGALAEA